MSLIVLAPLETRMYSIEEPRLPRSISIAPVVSPRDDRSLIEIPKLLFRLIGTQLFRLALRLLTIDSFGFHIGGGRSDDALGGNGVGFDLMFGDEGRLGNGVACGKL